MPIASVASFAALLEVVEACLQNAEGGKHRAYHLVMEFHKRNAEIVIREPAIKDRESQSRSDSPPRVFGE